MRLQIQVTMGLNPLHFCCFHAVCSSIKSWYFPYCAQSKDNWQLDLSELSRYLQKYSSIYLVY